MAQIIQIRRDTTTNWTNQNPILADGELAADKTLHIFKIGDGINHWLDLPVANIGATGPQGDGMTQAQILTRML